MIMTEIKVWKDTLLEIGEGQWPHEWVTLMINRYFASRDQKPAQAKEAMGIKTVSTIVKALQERAKTTDII